MKAAAIDRPAAPFPPPPPALSPSLALSPLPSVSTLALSWLGATHHLLCAGNRRLRARACEDLRAYRKTPTAEGFFSLRTVAIRSGHAAGEHEWALPDHSGSDVGSARTARARHGQRFPESDT